jgi:hypothetical protein
MAEVNTIFNIVNQHYVKIYLRSRLWDNWTKTTSKTQEDILYELANAIID